MTFKARAKTLKVRVALTVTINVDDYRLNYGNVGLASIRDDVRDAVADAVANGGVLANGIADVKLDRGGK